MSPRRLSLLALLLATLLLGACSDDGEADAATADDDATEASDDTGPSSDGDTDPDDDIVPADENGADICGALTGEMVSESIGITITGTDGYGLGTPQCSYSFDLDGTITTVSVAAQRTDEDLGGLTGQDALDLAVSANEAIPENEAQSSDVSIEGAEAAVAIEGRVISGVIALADDGHVYTVFSPALDQEQLAALTAVAVAALSG